MGWGEELRGEEGGETSWDIREINKLINENYNKIRK